MTLNKLINVYFIFHKGFLVTNLQKFTRYKSIMYSSKTLACIYHFQMMLFFANGITMFQISNF